jgi:hypothetical protein
MRFAILAAIALGSAEAGCFVAPDADGHVSAETLQAALDLTSTPTHLPGAAFGRCDGTRHILDGFGASALRWSASISPTASLRSEINVSNIVLSSPPLTSARATSSPISGTKPSLT